MEKKKFKKVFSKAFVAGLAAVALTAGANAESVRETTSDEITNGSYIIGITRFSNDYVINSGASRIATQNDMFFKGMAGYEDPGMYQLVGTNWISYAIDGTPSLVEPDSKLYNELSNKDIYYIDNEIKYLSVHYSKDLPAGYSLRFETDAIGRAISYDADTKMMSIPSTTKKITVYSHKAGTTNDADTVLDVYEKSSTDSVGNFSFVNQKSSTGTISGDALFNGSKLTATVNASRDSVKLTGTIPYVNDKTTTIGAGADGVGYRVGILISAPNGMAYNDYKNAVVKVDDGKNPVETYDPWSSHLVGDEKTGNTDFWFTPKIEKESNGKANYTITVDWNDDNKVDQTFTVVVDGTLAELPAGSLTGLKQDIFNEDNEVIGTAISANTIGDNVVFSGQYVNWDGEATVLVTPDTNYAAPSSVSYAAAHVKAYYTEKAIDKDGYEYDKKTYLTSGGGTSDTEANFTAAVSSVDDSGNRVVQLPLYFEKSDKGRVITVEIAWDAEFTQTFTVTLDSSATFNSEEVTISNVSVGAGNIGILEVSEDNHTVDIKNPLINWVSGSGEGKDGNRITAKLTADDPTFASDLGQLAVMIDGKLVTKKDGNGKDVPVSFKDDSTFDLSILIPNDTTVSTDNIYTGTHTIDVVYVGTDAKPLTTPIKVDTITINITNASVIDSLPGWMTAAPKTQVGGQDLSFALDSTSGDIHAYRIEQEPVYRVEGDEDSGIIGMQYLPLPYSYKYGNNVIYVDITNSADDTPESVVATLNGKEYTLDPETGGYYHIPVASNKTTVVTVSWDSVNKQEFRVSTDASKVRYSEPTKSTLKYTGATANSVPVDDSTTGTITVKNPEIKYALGSDMEVVETQEDGTEKVLDPVAGYKLNGLKIALSDGAVAEATDASDVKVTINGGNYNNSSIDADGVYADGIITLDPVMKTTNDKLVVTVTVGKYYVETFNILVQGAVPFNMSGELTYEANDGSPRPATSTVDKVLTYDADKKGYKLETTLTLADDSSLDEDIAKVEVADITFKADNTDAKGTSVAVSVTDGKQVIPVYFDRENTSATVYVTYDDGFVQTFEISASRASMNTVKLSNKIVTENGKNVLYVKKDSKITLSDLVEYTTPSSIKDDLTYTLADNAADSADYIVNAANGLLDTNELTALKVGKVKLTIKYSTELSIDVYVVVTLDDLKATSSYSFLDANNLVVSTNVAGGSGEADVTVNVYAYAVDDDGLGLYDYDTPYKANVVATYDSTNKVYTAVIPTLDDATTAIQKEQLRIEVTVQDKSYTTGVDNLKVVNEMETPKKVEYTVSFDENNGVAASVGTYGANKTIDYTKVPQPKKADKVTPNKNKYVYTFVGWFEDNADNFDKDGNLLDDAEAYATYADGTYTPSADAAKGVAKNTKLKAGYSVKYYNELGQELDLATGEVK